MKVVLPLTTLSYMSLFTEFALLTPADVAAGIARLPDKSSSADPLPVSTLKDVADLLTPFLTV